MTQREVHRYLFDIIQASQRIERFTVRKMLADYLADAFLRSAVERQLASIGEALVEALALDPGLAISMEDAQRIMAVRNGLAGDSAAMSGHTVWDIVQTSVPSLLRQVRALLGEEGP